MFTIKKQCWSTNTSKEWKVLRRQRFGQTIIDNIETINVTLKKQCWSINTSEECSKDKHSAKMHLGVKMRLSNCFHFVRRFFVHFFIFFSFVAFITLVDVSQIKKRHFNKLLRFEEASQFETSNDETSSDRTLQDDNDNSNGKYSLLWLQLMLLFGYCYQIY